MGANAEQTKIKHTGTTKDGRSSVAKLCIRPPIAWLVGFVLVNVAAMAIGQELALIPDVSITFWAPSGIFVAALLLNHWRTWPWWIGAACTAELIGNLLWFHNPVPRALLYFLANMAEAVTAAVLVTRVIAGRSNRFRPERLRSPRNAALFAVLAGMVAPVVGATIIAAVDSLIGKHAFWTAWPLVWLGDGTGLLLSAPLTLAAVQMWRRRRHIAPGPAVDFAITCGLTVLITWLALHGRLPTVYLTMPVIVWAAVRFQLAGAWLVLSAVILTVAFYTRAGLGEFAGSPEQMHDRLVRLQLFLGVSASSAMIVAALASLHVRARDHLRIANETLERRVAERTAAVQQVTEQLLLALDVGRAAAFTWDIPTDTFRIVHDGMSPAGESSRPLKFEDVIARVHPEDRASFERQVRLAIAGPGSCYKNEYRLVGEDGVSRWISDAGHVEFGPDGTAQRMVGLATDITERKHVEHRLRENEHRLRLALAAAGTGMWDWDVTTNVVVWSLECYRILGLREGEFDGTAAGFDRLVHPDDRSRVWAAVRAAVDAMTLYECEFRIVRPNGEIRWVSNVGRAIRDDGGGATRMIGTITDITERKHSEELLRASEDRFRTMANAAPAILWVTDPKASATFLSRAWHEYTGQSETESIGSDGLGWLDAVHADDRERSARTFLEANRRQSPFSMDYRVRRADGEYRWAVDSGRPRFDDTGRFLGYVGSVTDVHERVQAEAATRRIAETFSALVEQSPLGIYTVDADFRIRHVSKGALPAFQNVRPIFGSDFAEAIRIVWPEPIASEVVAIFQHTLTTGEPYVSPGLTHARADVGAIESYEWQTNRVMLDDGRYGVVCYFFDSTRLQRAHELIARHAAELDRALAERTREVQRAERALATSERMAAVGTLAAGLAHDMNNLLLPLGIRLDDLTSGKPLRPNHPPPIVSEDIKSELLVLSALLDHLRALARNLSLFSRDPRHEVGGERTNLGRWCEQVSRLIDASIGASIVVKWECPEGLPDAAIAPHRLTQAVQNLVHNARDAIVQTSDAQSQSVSRAPVGRITISATLADDRRHIVLSVADNGAGMSEQVLQHCREPFYTTKDRSPVNSATTGGSGLGLSLAHQIIELIGGTMKIESALGEGTTIFLYIPITVAGSASVARVEPKTQSQSAAGTPTARP